jgi:hypothetical protein
MDAHNATDDGQQPPTASSLNDRAIEAIARRVSELLQESAAPVQPRMVSAAEIARRFDVTRQWVYENAARLGAVRLGQGARPRLRFDPARVAASLHAGDVPAPAGPRRRSDAAQGRRDEADLIPLRKL